MDITEKMKDEHTLGLTGPVHQDHAYDSRTQVWWMKAKGGSIRLKTRNTPESKCIMCQAENEDMMHMLVCNKYPNKFITGIIEIPESRAQDMWKWLLHFDRSYKVRMKVSQWIRSRWKTRERTIHLGPDRGLWSTGDSNELGIPEIGTGESMTMDARNTVQADVKNEEEVKEIHTRRGPKSKCKVKINYDQL